MRIYLPATIAILEVLHDRGELMLGEDAVLAEGDSEDEEYDALLTAAETARVLAAELPPGARRRVVVVAEPTANDRPGATPPSRIRLTDVVAIHADPDDVPELGADPDDDLGWYATQEIADLLRG